MYRCVKCTTAPEYLADLFTVSNLDPEEWSDFVPKIVPSDRLALRGVTVKTPRTDNVLVRDLSFSLDVAEGLLVVDEPSEAA